VVKEHAEAIKRLQGEYGRIQARIQAMYVDKLDGKVDHGTFEQLSDGCRKQQDKCLREIERHQAADQHYLEEGISILEEGISILEMARKAHRLFETQPPSEKRKLLNSVVSKRSVKSDLARTLWVHCGNGEVHEEQRAQK
jgi:site-specific DNA recombinase